MDDDVKAGGVVQGDGYAICDINELDVGYGFRKLRPALGVTAFGINAIVIPPGYKSVPHYHDVQEETYFVHSGRIELELGDGSRHRLHPGCAARIDAPVVRTVRNVGPRDAVYVVVGGKDGYVGRDGRFPDGKRRLHSVDSLDS